MRALSGRIGLVLVAAAAAGAWTAACAPGRSCSVRAEADGSATMTCTDGVVATVKPGVKGAEGTAGAAGADGRPCTVERIDAKSARFTCPGGASGTLSNGADCTVTTAAAGVTIDCADGRRTVVPKVPPGLSGTLPPPAACGGVPVTGVCQGSVLNACGYDDINNNRVQDANEPSKLESIDCTTLPLAYADYPCTTDAQCGQARCNTDLGFCALDAGATCNADSAGASCVGVEGSSCVFGIFGNAQVDSQIIPLTCVNANGTPDGMGCEIKKGEGYVCAGTNTRCTATDMSAGGTPCTVGGPNTCPAGESCQELTFNDGTTRAVCYFAPKCDGNTLALDCLPNDQALVIDCVAFTGGRCGATTSGKPGCVGVPRNGPCDLEPDGRFQCAAGLTCQQVVGAGGQRQNLCQ